MREDIGYLLIALLVLAVVAAVFYTHRYLRNESLRLRGRRYRTVPRPFWMP